jgi:AAA family ATP:ADP antiporter
VSPDLHISARRNAWAAATTLFVIMAGHTVLETARDSLFLARMPVSQLPFTYLSIAVAALFAAELNGRVRRWLDSRRALALTLLVAAAGSFWFLRLFRLQVEIAPHAFYVWVAVVATLATGLFWLMLSELFTVADAKRSYAAVSAGGLLGAVAGGTLARYVAGAFSDTFLIVVGAGLFCVAALLTLGTCTPRSPHASPEPLPAPTEKAVRGPALRDLRSERYLRRLLLISLVSTVVATLTDYTFKAQVSRALVPSELGRFFGTYNAALSGVGLIVQLALAPRLLAGLGVGRALLVMPGLLTLAATAAAIVPGMVSALLLRGTDGGLRYSLQRTAAEVLYLPLPTQVRARWKMIVEALGQRGGQALASLLILCAMALSLPAWLLASCIALLALAWLLLAASVERQYLALFRARIKEGAVETRAEVPELDLHALESLVAALGSDSDDEVLASIDLLADYDRVHVIPSLLLYHPSRTVVLRALEVLASSNRHDYAGPARRLLERDDDEIRAAAMLALAGQLPAEALRGELEHALPIAARAAVLVALVAQRLDADGSAMRELDAGCAPDAPLATRMAFARALRIRRDPLAVPRLLLLASGAPPELQREVACAMLATPDPSYLPALLQMLGTRNARTLARDALVAIGSPALEALAIASADARLPRRLLAHFPRSISRFDSRAATELLLERLDLETDGWVRFKIIRGLGQLRAHIQPRTHARRVFEHARRNLTSAVRFMAFRVFTENDLQRESWPRTQGSNLLTAALRDKEQHALDRAVRLIGLLHKADEIHHIRQAFAGPSSRLRAEGLELLVHRVPADLAQVLTLLLGDGPDELRLVTRAAEILSLKLPETSYEDRLGLLLDDNSEALRSVAAFHVGELRLRRLHAPLSKAAARTSGLSFEVFARVGKLLDETEGSLGEPLPAVRIS